MYAVKQISTHAPAGGATKPRNISHPVRTDFYSRPCGRGDTAAKTNRMRQNLFLLTPLREGRPCLPRRRAQRAAHFYSRPCGRGDAGQLRSTRTTYHFYSRPCGRGDSDGLYNALIRRGISTHAPAGGATEMARSRCSLRSSFLLTPLREGRRKPEDATSSQAINFYSRPCGRGDCRKLHKADDSIYFYSRPCGRGDHGSSASDSPRARFLLTPLREGRRN